MHQKKVVMEIFLFSMGKVSAKEQQALRKEKLRKDDNKYKQYLEKDRLWKEEERLDAATKMTDTEKEEFKLKENI